MNLRRVILLFAIVLGLAAIASAIAGPPKPDDEKGQTATESVERSEPSASPQPGTESAELTTIRFPAKGKPRRELEQGRPATVLVDVQEAGQVVLEGLGLTDTAEPLTPAMFDVLAQRTGSYAVILAPASGTSPRTVGVLEVVSAGK